MAVSEPRLHHPNSDELLVPAGSGVVGGTRSGESTPRSIAGGVDSGKYRNPIVIQYDIRMPGITKISAHVWFKVKAKFNSMIFKDIIDRFTLYHIGAKIST
jgi:hypothetical protein